MNLDKLIKIANYFDKNKQFNNADFISKYLKIASDTDEGDSIESIIEGIQKKIEPLVGQPQLTESNPTVRERVPFERAQEEYLELKSKIISKIAEYKIAMKENNFKFFKNQANFAEYNAMRKRLNVLEYDIAKGLQKFQPMFELRPSEIEDWNTRNSEMVEFLNHHEEFTDNCMEFENELSNKTVLVEKEYDSLVYEFSPKIVDLGLKYGVVLHEGKRDNEYFFLIDTSYGKIAQLIPTWVERIGWEDTPQGIDFPSYIEITKTDNGYAFKSNKTETKDLARVNPFETIKEYISNDMKRHSAQNALYREKLKERVKTPPASFFSSQDEFEETIEFINEQNEKIDEENQAINERNESRIKYVLQWYIDTDRYRNYQHNRRDLTKSIKGKTFAEIPKSRQDIIRIFRGIGKDEVAHMLFGIKASEKGEDRYSDEFKTWWNNLDEQLDKYGID